MPNFQGRNMGKHDKLISVPVFQKKTQKKKNSHIGQWFCLLFSAQHIVLTEVTDNGNKDNERY